MWFFSLDAANRLAVAIARTFWESLLAAVGIERPASAPLVHFASGVDVEIFGLQ